MLLDTSTLDKVYQKWKYGDRLSETRWPEHYSRLGHRNQRFEDWLWSQGFTVVQKDKKRYLKFNGDSKNVTLFLLKWL
jgi:hypothetical protein